MNKPLANVTVIELSTYYAAPTAGLLLADWGANVIKIETPNGDPERVLAKMREITMCNDLENPYFDLVNANKRFVSVDTRTPEGLAVLKKLIAKADIFLTNYRNSVLEKLGLTYAELRTGKPELVYGQALGFGDRGPDRDLPGFDYTAGFARAGILSNMTPNGSPEPITPYCAYIDSQCGCLLAAGVLAAYTGAKATGLGDYVTNSLYGTSVFMSRAPLTEALFGKVFPPKLENCSQPLVNFYKGSDDRWITFCISNHNRFFNTFMTVLDRPDLIDHPIYSNIGTCTEQGKIKELIAIIKEEVAKQDSKTLRDRCLAADLLVELGFSFGEIVADEQARANDYVRTITYSTGSQIDVFPNPVHFENAGAHEFRTSARIGYHNDEVLAEFGFAAEEISALRERNAIV